MKVFGGLLRNLAGLGRSVVVRRRTDEPADDWSAPPEPSMFGGVDEQMAS